MAHMFRFIGQRVDNEIWEISGDEAHHATRVLRLKEGDSVEICDLKGGTASGAINTSNKNALSVQVRQVQFEEKTVQPLIVAIGALSPQTANDIIAPLVELGVDELIFFHQAQLPKFRLQDKHIERWTHLARNALKQCKRAWLPDVRSADSLESLLAALGPKRIPEKYYLDPQAHQPLRPGLGPRGAILVVGGEVGLRDEELEALNGCGFQGASLGRHILRATTAAIAGAAVLVSETQLR